MFNSLQKWSARKEVDHAQTERRGDDREAEVSVYESETPCTLTVMFLL